MLWQQTLILNLLRRSEGVKKVKKNALFLNKYPIFADTFETEIKYESYKSKRWQYIHELISGRVFRRELPEQPTAVPQ